MKIHVRVNRLLRIGTCHWEAMVPSRQRNKHCQAIRVNIGLEYHPDFPIFWLKNKNVKFAIFFWENISSNWKEICAMLTKFKDFYWFFYFYVIREIRHFFTFRKKKMKGLLRLNAYKVSRIISWFSPSKWKDIIGPANFTIFHDLFTFS